MPLLSCSRVVQAFDSPPCVQVTGAPQAEAQWAKKARISEYRVQFCRFASVMLVFSLPLKVRSALKRAGLGLHSAGPEVRVGRMHVPYLHLHDVLVDTPSSSPLGRWTTDSRQRTPRPHDRRTQPPDLRLLVILRCCTCSALDVSPNYSHDRKLRPSLPKHLRWEVSGICRKHCLKLRL